MLGEWKIYLSFLRTCITFSIHCVPTKYNDLGCITGFAVLVFFHFTFLKIIYRLQFLFLIMFPAYQARATLIHILELQIQRRKQAVDDIKRYGSFTFKSMGMFHILLNDTFSFLFLVAFLLY